MVKYNILSQDGYKYVITYNDNLKSKDYTLHRFSSSHLDNLGEKIFGCIDNGNGFVFDKKLKSNMDYSELLELKLLINAIASIDLDFTEPHILHKETSGISI